MQKYFVASLVALCAISAAMAVGQTDTAQPKPEFRAEQPKAHAPLRVAPFSRTNFKECPTASVQTQVQRNAQATQCL